MLRFALLLSLSACTGKDSPEGNARPVDTGEADADTGADSGDDTDSDSDEPPPECEEGTELVGD